MRFDEKKKRKKKKLNFNKFANYSARKEEKSWSI